TRTHLDMLDRYGGLLPLREQVGVKVDELRTIRTELDDLRTNEARRVERIAELRMLLEDVQAAALRSDEEQELLQERSMMQNAVRITELINAAYSNLYQGDESGRTPTRPAVELMGLIANDLGDLSNLDPAVAALSEQATDVLYRLEDLASAVRDYRDRLDFDPRRLDEIEERMTLLRSLQAQVLAAIVLP
ncbi:MAG: DNA repair protein RecN, partial [Chloroflexaceae bacterium]|nr:DNA repair protein RecN [Chloroflexaceae bacterium]